MLRGIPAMDHIINDWSSTPSPSPPLPQQAASMNTMSNNAVGPMAGNGSAVDQWIPPAHLVPRSGSPVPRYSHHSNGSGPPSPLLSPVGTPPMMSSSSSSAHHSQSATPTNDCSASPLSSASTSPTRYSPSPLMASPRIRSRLVDLDSEDDGTRGRAMDEFAENQKRRERRRSQNMGNTGGMVIMNMDAQQHHHDAQATVTGVMTGRYGICCNDVNHRHLTVSADITTSQASSAAPYPTNTNDHHIITIHDTNTNPLSSNTLSICTSSLVAAMASSSSSSGNSSPFAFPPHTIPASYSAFSASPPLQPSRLSSANDDNHHLGNNNSNSSSNNMTMNQSNSLSTSSSPASQSIAPLTPSAAAAAIVPSPPLSINHSMPFEDINDGCNGHYSPTLSHIGVSAVSASPLVSLRTRVTTNYNNSNSNNGVIPSSVLVPLTGNNTNSTNANNSNSNNNGNNSPNPSGKSKRDKSQDPDNPTPIFHLPTALLNEGGMGGRARRNAANAANNANNGNNGPNNTGSTNANGSTTTSPSTISSSPSSSPGQSPIMSASAGSLHSLRARSMTSFTLPANALGHGSPSASPSQQQSRIAPTRPDSPPAMDAMAMLRLADDHAHSHSRRTNRRGLATITEKRALTAPMPVRRLPSPSRAMTHHSNTSVDGVPMVSPMVIHHSHHQSIDSSSDAEGFDPSIIMLSPNGVSSMSSAASASSSPLPSPPYGSGAETHGHSAPPPRRTFASALAAANAARRYQATTASTSSPLPPTVPVMNNNGTGRQPQRRHSPPSTMIVTNESYVHASPHMLSPPHANIHIGSYPSSSSSSPGSLPSPHHQYQHQHHHRSPSAHTMNTHSPQRRASPPSHQMYGNNGSGYISKNTQFVTSHSASTSSSSPSSYTNPNYNSNNNINNSNNNNNYSVPVNGNGNNGGYHTHTRRY